MSRLTLGSGCGLAGIAYMLRGATVFLTDLPHIVTALTDRNAQAIYLQALREQGDDDMGHSSLEIKKPTCFPVDWTKHASNVHALDISSQYDIVLLTDCVFSAQLVNDLVATILKYSGPRSTIICCHEIRDEEANAAFLEEFSRHFTWKKVAKSKMDKDYTNDLIEIIVGKPKKVK
jgi:predicted nicotinamide N-methyase